MGRSYWSRNAIKRFGKLASSTVSARPVSLIGHGVVKREEEKEDDEEGEDQVNVNFATVFPHGNTMLRREPHLLRKERAASVSATLRQYRFDP